VEDASRLSEPNLPNGVFGLITINGERISYRVRNTDNNTLSGLRRGTAGTGAADHPVDSPVYDIGRGNLLPAEYQDRLVVENFLGDGSTTVFIADTIDLTTEDSMLQLDALEVYVGGIKQSEHFIGDGNTVTFALSGIVALTDSVVTVNNAVQTDITDYSITKNLFDKKPNCIKKWFAVNVEYQHQDLIPIPLGVSNPNCTITLKVNSIKNNNIEKEKLLYINHRIETNANVRKPIYNLFKTNDWCTILQPNLSLQDYELNLKKHHYMLCPRGNGVDTHRLWECLYSGVVPIVQKQITHNNLYDLPILFVDNYEQITEDFLKENLFRLKNKNLEKLNLYWWGNFIKEKNEWTNK
jgi:hypothetical protein